MYSVNEYIFFDMRKFSNVIWQFYLFVSQLCSAFNSEEMSFVIARLLSLREFMMKNSQFASYLVAER